MPTRILIVDDDGETRTLLRLLLERHGYEVELAAHGQAALDALGANQSLVPALILLDLEMPVMPGRQLVSLLKSYSRLATIPIVVLSAADPSQYPSLQIDRFLTKPCDPAQLLEAIASLVQRPQ